MTHADEDFALFRGDLIAYLASRLELPPEDVLNRLGNWLVEPVPEASREQYLRINHPRRRPY